jgi:hypothetical protein
MHLSEPTVASTVYTTPVRITKTNTVVNAKGLAQHMSASNVVTSVAFVLEASNPQFQPDGGAFVNSVQVTLATATPGAAIHYTLDDTDPSITSPKYTGSFAAATTGLVIKAIATKGGLAPSLIAASASFTIKASPPVLDPAEGTFTGVALIKVTSATPGSELRCTLDGTEPTTDTPVVSSPLAITQTGSLARCVATRAGLTVSDVTSMASGLVIKATPPDMTPNGGSFTNQAAIVMSCATEGCTMRYTIDGSVPGLSSPVYTEPVVVTMTGTVVKCISVADGKATSDVAASSALSIYASAPSFLANGTIWGVHDSTEEDYVENAFISMESNTLDNVIVYTIDGQIPSDLIGTLYSKPYEDLNFGQETLRARALKNGLLPSPVSSSVIYDIVHKSPIPKITPDTGGPFTTRVLVTIDSPLLSTGKILVTTDGSMPTSRSRVYSEPFLISMYGTTIVKTMATKSHQADSEIASASFLVLEQVQPPVFENSHFGAFIDIVTVHIKCATDGATIRYTTDGSTPNAASTAYTDEGITLGLAEDGTEKQYVLQAFALKPPDMGNSFVCLRPSDSDNLCTLTINCTII